MSAQAGVAAGAAVTVVTATTMVAMVTGMAAGAVVTVGTATTMVVSAATTRTAVGKATTVAGATTAAKALVRCK